MEVVRADTGRTALVVASASGALPMLAVGLMEPSFLRPGALPVLTAVITFTAVTVAIAVHAGRLTDTQFTILGSGGILGVAISAYLIADPAGARAVTSMLSVVPAIAASSSSSRVIAALTAASMALATALSLMSLESSGRAVTLIATGAAATIVLVPVVLILVLRRSVTAMNRQLEVVLANTDSLTGLLNRRGLLAAAEATVRDACEQSTDLTALIIDVDHFKTVNDTYGHAAGDRMLATVARALEEALAARTAEPRGILARIGGDEFFALLPSTACSTLGSVMVDRVRSNCEITVSAGSVTVAFGTSDAQATHAALTVTNPGLRLDSDPDTPAVRLGAGHAVDLMLRAADRGLYTAKTLGGNRACHLGTHAFASLNNASPERTPTGSCHTVSQQHLSETTDSRR